MRIRIDEHIADQIVEDYFKREAAKKEARRIAYEANCDIFGQPKVVLPPGQTNMLEYFKALRAQDNLIRLQRAQKAALFGH